MISRSKFVFGLTTIGLALVLFMEGAKFIPSAEAGLISLLDVVLGPLWVFIAFGENPGPGALHRRRDRRAAAGAEAGTGSVRSREE